MAPAGIFSVDRRRHLTEAALGYIEEHGLLDLSLRSLATAIGTSDRMLIYHFGTKDQLISATLQLANQRLIETLRLAEAAIRGPADLIEYAWTLFTDPKVRGASVLYIELCALSVRDPEIWLAAHHSLRQPWLDLIARGLGEFETPIEPEILGVLIFGTIDGLLLDRLVASDVRPVDEALAAFAQLVGKAGVPPTEA